MSRRLGQCLRISVVVTLSAAVSLSACSKGGSSSEGGYATELAEISSALRPKATQLAQLEVEQLMKQLDSTGKRDNNAVRSALSGPTADLDNFICAEVKKHSDVKKGDVEKAVRDLDAVLTEQTMVEMGRQPRLLQDFGFTTWGKWPQFVLKSPAPPADASVGDLATTVPQVVKAEFIAPEGGLKLPSAGESGYEAFKQWYAFESGDDNGLFEAASSLGEPVRQSIRSCFAGT